MRLLAHGSSIRSRLDRGLALGLFALAQIELWWPRTIPGPLWLAFVAHLHGYAPRRVPTGTAAPRAGCSSPRRTCRRRRLRASRARSALLGAWICTLYGLAVWADRRDFVVGCGVVLIGIGFASFWLHQFVGGIAHRSPAFRFSR